MIDYQVLCQTIADWRGGQRPASGPHDQAQAASPEEVEEVASGLVVMDDDSALTYEEVPSEGGGYEDEGEVTYGDEQAASDYADAEVEVEPEADDEYADADDVVVDTDDDEIPGE